MSFLLTLFSLNNNDSSAVCYFLRARLTKFYFFGTDGKKSNENETEKSIRHAFMVEVGDARISHTWTHTHAIRMW